MLSMDLRKLLRNCHEGWNDPVFTLVLNHPPKGGWMAMSFSSLAEQEGLKGDVDTIKQDRTTRKKGSSPGNESAGAAALTDASKFSHNADMEAPTEATPRCWSQGDLGSEPACSASAM